MVRNYYHLTSLAVSGCLLVLLAACGPFGSSGSGPTPTASTGGARATPTTGGAASTPTTAPMPATQTACPPAGSARAAIFAPLVLGPHQNIVYLFNQGTSSSSYIGEIKRYDTSTGHKAIIVNSPKSRIIDAQISTDGQWILFTTLVSGQWALQLVRMDGQGLQTLHCSMNEIRSIQWSPDQKAVVFMASVSVSSATVDLLDLATGHLQVELLEPTTGGSIFASVATWLDDTHIYMTSYGTNTEGEPQSLYALDIAKGANQHVSDLIKVFGYSGYCLSFDSSVDNSKLFVSTCNAYLGDGPHFQQGPSTIIAEPVLGGPQTTVYTNPTIAITTVRVIYRTTMLLLIQNLGGDTSHNGLWKMNLDGTGLTRLTTAGAGQMSWLNVTSLTWSNVSRDGGMYALKISSNNGTTQALLIGSLGGTSPSAFATVSGTGGVGIVGWTTM